jgi:hypothetical protein
MKWYIGMLKVFRPSFEVVKKGRILHFVSGDRRFQGAFAFHDNITRQIITIVQSTHPVMGYYY